MLAYLVCRLRHRASWVLQGTRVRGQTHGLYRCAVCGETHIRPLP